MPRRGDRAPPKVHPPGSLGWWALKYLERQRARNFSESTIAQRQASLKLFFAWCEERTIHRPEEVTRAVVEAYQRHLFYLRDDEERALAFATQRSRLTSVRGLFRWLARENVLPSNPAGELEMPRLEQRLPRSVLTPGEAEKVLMQPSVHDVYGLRDRALLEVLYSTGIRRRELSELRTTSIDVERGTMMVRQGKGKKDRMVPIGERASAWVAKYVTDSRPLLVLAPDDGVLFLTQSGHPFSLSRLTQMTREYVAAAEIGKTGACHLFRHTMATAMLEGGADVRYIQEMLGHADVSTTQIYTRVSIRKLKEVHTTTHPGANLNASTEPASEE